ncbi:RNA-directed DNA polymerase, eukaryota, partial [Tanacetum coccineum]
LADWDVKAESGSLTSFDRLKRDEDLVDLQFIEQKEGDSHKQKSRIKWAIEGDENSKFFHYVVRKKTRRQNINGLKINGSWVEDPTSIFGATYNHFANRFRESNPSRLKFHSLLFKRLDQEDIVLLESPFSMDEVKAAVWDCCSSKSPGPDGQNFKFIKKYWEFIKFEFFNFVKYFESLGSLARGCNASFIVLIPKVSDPLDLSDYRPVSLIGCMYKVLSKLLASRLSQVIHKLISPNQTTFLKGRQILDGSLVANEIVNFAKKEGINLFLFKVDFKKAFDSVNWNFLMDIMA